MKDSSSGGGFQGLFRKGTKNTNNQAVPQSMQAPSVLKSGTVVGEEGMLQSMNALSQNPSYTETMSIQDFRDGLQQLITIEDKLSLYRSQFPQDPFQFDLGHTSQTLQLSPAHQSAMSTFTVNLSWTQLDMSQLLLRSIAESHTNVAPVDDSPEIRKKYSVIKPTVAESVAHYFPQLQAILALTITKAFNQNILNDVLSGSISPYNLQVFNSLLSTISQWGYFLMAGHGQKLKPGFMNYMRTRVAEMLQVLQGIKDQSKGAQNEKSSMEMMISDSNPVYAQSLPTSGLLSSQVKPFEESKVAKMNDNAGLESLFFSASILAAAFFHYQIQTSAVSSGQETNLSLILIPLLRISAQNHELSLNKLSKKCQQSLENVLRLINTTQTQNSFLQLVIGAQQDFQELSISQIILKMSLKVSAEGNKRQTTRLGAGGTPSVSFLKNEKVAQCLQQLAMRNLQLFVSQYVLVKNRQKLDDVVPAKSGKNPQQDDEQSRYPPVFIMSENTQKELQVLQSNSPSKILQKCSLFEGEGMKEAQRNWINVALPILNLSIGVIKSAQQSGSLLQSLIRATQDTMKQILYFLGHFQLTYGEHFTVDKINSLSDLPDYLDTTCQITQSFQSVMQLHQSESKSGQEALSSLFEDLGNQMLKGLYSKVDTSCYIRSIYLTFLNKYQSIASQGVRSGSLVESVIGSGGNDRLSKGMVSIIQKFFTFHFYPESRIKDVEPLDSIKNRESYCNLVAKFKQIEQKIPINQQQKAQIGREGWAVQEVNRILVQQTAFELINSVAQVFPKIADQALGQVNSVIASETNETSYNVLYQHFKLAISVIWKDFPKSNKSFYDLLVGSFIQPKAGDESLNAFKTWSPIKALQGTESFQAFWNIVAIKVKDHLKAKAAYIKILDAYYKSASSKQQEVIDAVLKANAPKAPEGLLRDQSFSMLKKLLMFGITNMEVGTLLEVKLKEILKETKDYEHSFEIKIAICSMLVIMKDRQQKQFDALLRYESLLKSVYEYIAIIDVKYGGEKPQAAGSAKRMFEGDAQTWEQEKELKVKQIKSIVGQSVNLICNYIDYKESPHCLIPLNIEKETTGVLPPITLEIISRKSSDYSFDEIYASLKKVVTRSNMYGGFFVEQLLRIFFFQRTELQNLSLVASNQQLPELFIDIMGTPILEQIITFLLEATETMFQNAPPIVKAFVQYLHSRIVTSTNSHLRLARFAKCLNPTIIKQLKKLMIFIREKEDQGLQESSQLMKDVVVKVLSATNKSPIYKEFLTFFHEIFYYNKDMDQVDFDLASDTLYVMNNLLKASQYKQQSEQLAFRNIQFDGVQDYFMFSDITPGLILSDNFKVPQENFSIALLFRINIAQVKAAQEKQASLGLDGSTLTMTFFQLIDRTFSESYQPFNIIINVVGDRLKVFDFDCKMDEAWHLLVVQFEFKKNALSKKTHSVKIYIDSLAKSQQVSRDIKHTFHKSHDHILAYGCNAIDILGGALKMNPSPVISTQMMSSQMVSTNAGTLNLNQEFRSEHYFQGSLSLPFIFTKLESDKQADLPALVEFLVRSIINKSTVGITTTEYVGSMRGLSRVAQKDSYFGNFESHDFNEEVILLHQKTQQVLDHIGTVHVMKPHEIIENIGGYKLLYPVFEKSLHSNLPPHQKADLWKLLFKILRTFMNTDPGHILRLYKNKHLIETLKSCVIRAGINQILTKDLLLEIISVVRDIHSNRQADMLEEFYRDYMLRVILDETVCDLQQWDTRSGRVGKVFEEIVESLVSLYNDEESIQERRIAQMKGSRRIDDGQPSRELFNLPQVANDIYKKLISLISRYSQESSSYLKHTKKLAYILVKIIVRNSQKSNFQQLIISIQNFSKANNPNLRATLLAHLKILEGVIADPEFTSKRDLMETLRSNYSREKMMQHLNQSHAYENPDYSSMEEFGTVEDDIIARTLRIVVQAQYKMGQGQLPMHTLRMGQPLTVYEDQKQAFIKELIENLKQNPKNIRLQKTMCSIILIPIMRKQQLQNVKYNPAFLKECLKNNQKLNLLELMSSQDFDRDILALAIRLFKWYDMETKLVFLDFYRQLIEENCHGHNIEDFTTFQKKNFLQQMRNLLLSKQEHFILSIVQNSIITGQQEPQIKNFAERIVASTIKCYFNSSLEMEVEGVLYDEEVSMLRTIKKLLVMLEPIEDSLLSVLNEVLRYVQEVVNWVWSYVLHDTNRTNLNLKLILFLQVIEEIVMKKMGSQGQRNGDVSILHKEPFYELFARLLIIFDDIKMIYFDYPSPTVVDTNKRNTIVTGMIRQKETMVARDIIFLAGGPLRMFMTLLLQILRKMKPGSNLVQKTRTISSDQEDEVFQMQEEEKQLQPEETEVRHLDDSFENYQYFDCAVELFRFLLFKEETHFITQYRPVPTIEAETPGASNQAPLFRLIYNTLHQQKRTLFVMQPADLTKSFIESYNEIPDSKDSISTTPGFLPLVLLTELYEIIRRKYSFIKPLEKDSQEPLTFQVDQFDQRHHLMSIIALFYDVMKHSYVSNEFKENIGFMMATITDPRIKDEIFDSLHPVKMKNRMRKAGNRAFFLSKAAEYYLSHKLNMTDSVLEAATANVDRGTEHDPNAANGLRANLQDHYFLRQSEKIAQGFVDVTNNEHAHLSEERKEDEAMLFAQAALEGIQNAETRERQQYSKDVTQYQEELIAFLSKWYLSLRDYFDTHKKSTKSPNVTPETAFKQSITPGTDFASEPLIITEFKAHYIDNARANEIMVALRLASTEKFKHVYSYNLATREEEEIKRILQKFQVIDQTGEERKLPGHLPKLKLGGIQSLATADNLTQSANSHRDPHLNKLNTPNLASSKGSSDENQIPPTVAGGIRKRSADDTDNVFQFEAVGERNSSQGKMSMQSNQQRPPPVTEFNMQQSTFGGKRKGIEKKGNEKYRNMEYYYSKQCYKKQVKRLLDDPSSIWYDNLEQMKKDYSDMKEIYDLVCTLNDQEINVNQQQIAQLASISQTKSESQGGIEPTQSLQQEPQEEEKKQLAAKSIIKPQAAQVPAPGGVLSSFKPRHYDHFVRLRRTYDRWGRMLLLKPDRKYKQRKFLISHKYFVHDTMKNLFAVALLEDQDFSDYKALVAQLEQQEKQRNGNEDSENPQQSPLKSQTLQSDQFKRLRELLLQKIEQNDFLYTLLTDPDSFMNDDNKPFVYKAMTKYTDPSISLICEVQYITAEGAQLGDLYLSGQYLMFKSKPDRVRSEVKFAMKRDQVIKKTNKIWQIAQLEQVFKRRFLLMHQGVEIFTRDKKSYFFNLLTVEACQSFLQTLKKICINNNKMNPSKKVDLIDDAKNEFKSRKFVELWTKGDISTQEFLLLLNKYSGRSFNDFGQYPIFPWIISDYSCTYDELKQKTDKNEIEGYRDLLLNSGVLSEKKREIAQTQFEANIEGDEMIYGAEKYHLKFGFSNRIFSLGYLIRMEPFTDNFIKVNDGLDNPDRIFYSFQDQWTSVMNDKQNNSELTPEFFYMPEIFRNHNLANLGRSRSNMPVNEVTLPKWATNEHDFIRIHREMLESKHVSYTIRFWIDMLFGVRQKDVECMNRFYCYAYEDWVNANVDQIQDHNVETILEFLQVPMKILPKPLFNLDKKGGIGFSLQVPQQMGMQPIDEENEDMEDEDMNNTSQMSKQQPQNLQQMAKQKQMNAMSNQVTTQFGKNKAKISMDVQKQAQLNMMMNSRTARDPSGGVDPLRVGVAQVAADQKSQSLIQKLIEGNISQNQKRTENDLKKIIESHKIDKPEEVNLLHMTFSQLTGRCIVFLADKQSGQVNCVACRESFLQEDLKNPRPLGGLKRQHLRGDLDNIFQLYGGGIGDKNTQSMKQPLLFTCQNLDNSIKVFDLTIKKGSQIVHQERKHNNMVTAIKFSGDFKNFISGDADGVLCHYVRNLDESEDQTSQSVLLSGNLQDKAVGNMMQANKLGALENTGAKCFPFSLKYKFQDHQGAVMAIDINKTLDMYVTASRDGTIVLRCLRSSALWKVIQLEKLSQPNIEIQSLKLSLHGYIVIMMRNQAKFYTFVFSLNGDQLVSTQREVEQFEFKYAQLTEKEDHLIMVFNQKIRKEDKEMTGVIRVSRLYDLEKDPKRDNLQKTFYQMVNEQLNGHTSSRQKSQMQSQSHRSAMQSENAYGFTKQNMPSIVSFALSHDESKMNIYLKSGEIVCFDESRSTIIEQLDDFGLA